MERLTYDFCFNGVHCNQIKGADNLECSEVCEREGSCKECPIARAFDRLAAIEDILGDDYDLDHLRELVEADKAGRCEILRFAPDAEIYRVWPGVGRRPAFMTAHYALDKNFCIEAQLWNNAYSTREEAEAALEKMKEAKA